MYVARTNKKLGQIKPSLCIAQVSILPPTRRLSPMHTLHFELERDVITGGGRLCPGWFNTTTQIGQMSEPLGPILLKWRSRGRWTKAFE